MSNADSAANRHKVIIRSLEEWSKCKAQPGVAVLLQCGSPTCEKCPAFGECVEKLKSSFAFEHFYLNTHDAEEELLQELRVTKLPAYFLLRDERVATEQAASPETLERAVENMCAPRFTTDADF